MRLMMAASVLGEGAGFRPFMEPVPDQEWWFVLLLPLAVGIALVYKAIKLEDLDGLWWEVGRLSFQIVAFMVLSAVLLWLILRAMH